MLVYNVQTFNPKPNTFPELASQKISEAIAKQHPLKRIGEGLDSAALAKFLLSSESSWITGQIIGVDGGRSNIG